MESVVEVFADVTCPFAHVGLRRFAQQRSMAGRDDLRLRVRAWPLELVNGEPLDASVVNEEVNEIREQVAPDLFRGFDETTFPKSSLPALALASAAYGHAPDVGEKVSFEMRDLLFEWGIDISDPSVLAEIAARHEVTMAAGIAEVVSDHEDGERRGVKGSPHFFAGDAGHFCPGLDVNRDREGHLHVTANPHAFDRFVAALL